MRLSRAVFSYKRWNEKATEFLQTKAGRRLRIGLLAGTIVAYPVASLLTNGPFINFSFPYRYAVEKLPLRLQKIAEEEYARFLETESRVPKDAVVTQHIGKTVGDYETVAAGSLGVRTGLHVAVPFHARFKDVEEALEYFKVAEAFYYETQKNPLEIQKTGGAPPGSLSTSLLAVLKIFA
ncbi:hypothetical protein Y032_0037g3473 [Ancylostoma ceylanicum]|uniref:Uncharacterized protein n=1 Tax=Ancylostoma ceylanicum TaxID=53326 RepID=A0A016UKH0_9BILA|nr:hypothetical protein Y032_0037g3473 [Ancylostoma ceylanicum]